MDNVKSKEVFDSFQRLSRAIRRRSVIINPDFVASSQNSVLRIIAANDGIIFGDLARLLEIRPSSLSVKLKKLEERGYTLRRKDKSSSRFTYVHITQKGYEFLENYKEAEYPDFCDCLTQEEKLFFCDICNRLSANYNRILDEEKEARLAERLADKSALPNETE